MNFDHYAAEDFFDEMIAENGKPAHFRGGALPAD